MKLKENIDYATFLKQVRTCKGQVYYTTLDGDRLNLKSILSEYVFLSAATASNLIKNGNLSSTHIDDYKLLKDYLEVEE